jgi:hypothetical protein
LLHLGRSFFRQRYGYAVVVFGEAGFGELEFYFGEDVGG